MFTFSLLRCVGSAFPVQTAEIVKITNFDDFCSIQPKNFSFINQ